jgi:hypothetical protein
MEVTVNLKKGTVPQECIIKLLTQNNIESWVSKYPNCVRISGKTILLVSSTNELKESKNIFDLVVFYTIKYVNHSALLKIKIWSHNDPESTIGSYEFKDPEELIPYLTK